MPLDLQAMSNFGVRSSVTQVQAIIDSRSPFRLNTNMARTIIPPALPG
jgi:hypothetical protein